MSEIFFDKWVNCRAADLDSVDNPNAAWRREGLIEILGDRVADAWEMYDVQCSQDRNHGGARAGDLECRRP